MKLTTFNKLNNFCRTYKYRFGQVVSCVADIAGEDLFYLPDEELDEAMLAWIKNTEEKIKSIK